MEEEQPQHQLLPFGSDPNIGSSRRGGQPLLSLDQQHSARDAVGEIRQEETATATATATTTTTTTTTALQQHHHHQRQQQETTTVSVRPGFLFSTSAFQPQADTTNQHVEGEEEEVLGAASLLPSSSFFQQSLGSSVPNRYDMNPNLVNSNIHGISLQIQTPQSQLPPQQQQTSGNDEFTPDAAAVEATPFSPLPSSLDHVPSFVDTTAPQAPSTNRFSSFSRPRNSNANNNNPTTMRLRIPVGGQIHFTTSADGTRHIFATTAPSPLQQQPTTATNNSPSNGVSMQPVFPHLLWGPPQIYASSNTPAQNWNPSENQTAAPAAVNSNPALPSARRMRSAPSDVAQTIREEPSSATQAQTVARAASAPSSGNNPADNGNRRRRPANSFMSATTNQGVPIHLFNASAPSPPSIPNIHVPAPQPLVLPDHKQNLVEQQVEEEGDDGDNINEHAGTSVDRFKCNLCFEFMAQAFGHDGCSLRLCEKCLAKIRQPGNSQTSVSEIRCPTCRMLGEYRLDEEINAQMRARPPTLRCRYADCAEAGRKFSLAEIDAHEESCDAVRVTCRFQCLGCEWTGLRRDLKAHEDDDCALCKVSGLALQHLGLIAQFQHITMQLHMRYTGLYQYQQQLRGHVQSLVASFNRSESHQEAVIRQTVARGPESSAAASPNNPLDVVNYVVALCSSTPTLAADSRGRGRWTDMETSEGRASVFNQIMLVPTLILSLGFCFKQVSGMRQVLVEITAGRQTKMDAIEILASLLCVLMGSGIVFGSFWIDRASSLTWKCFRLGAGEYHLACSVLSIGSALLHGSFFLDACFHAGWWYAAFFYAFITFVTLIPPMIFIMLALEQGRDGSQNDTTKSWKLVAHYGRAAEPVLNGLWLGFAWGPTDAVNPEILLLLAILYLVLVNSKIQRRIALPIVGIASAVFAGLVQHTRDPIDTRALILFVLSTWTALIFQRCVAVTVFYVCSKAWRFVQLGGHPVLLSCLFAWTFLLALV